MQQIHYQFAIEAESPIAHASENIGNESIAMRRKTRQADGSFAMVPVVTSDTMRHGMREAAANAFLDAAGLLGDGALTRAALRLLYSGGMVTGRGDSGAISLDRFREMVELCPPLALFGGCCDSRVIPGRLQVDDAILVCKENERFVPDWAKALGGELDTCRAFVERNQRVRMDPLLDPMKRKQLTDGEQVEATKQLTAGERAHDTNDAIARDEAKSTMLPRTFETVVQGSLFYWSITCTCLNDLDVDTLNTSLAAFLYRPVVGGKKATGHGRLRVIAARNVEVRRPAETGETLDTSTLGERAGSLFRKHVGERKDAIRSWLGKVDA